MRLSDVLPQLWPVHPAAATDPTGLLNGPKPAGRPDTGDAALIASQFARRMGEALADPGYWGYALRHSYWRCVTDLCAAADLCGDDRLPDLPPPAGTLPDVPATLAALEGYGRRMLAEVLAAASCRPRTPARTVTLPDGTVRTTKIVQRACNGCGQLLGDVTDAEMEDAVAGAPLSDVRAECPTCRPAAQPAAGP